MGFFSKTPAAPKSSMKLSELLKERGYLYQHSSPVEEIVDGPKRTLYLGIDPTSDSMHVGHLQAMLVLRRFLEDGHKVILVLGGGTGMIGDPSGKSEERVLLDQQAIARNMVGIKAQAKRLFASGNFRMLNNLDWLGQLPLINFLRDIGKHFSVNTMIQRDSVKERLEGREQGISYTEFSYMLLQAYDFLHLNEAERCDLQLGASDQWGNMVSGVDLIRRKTGRTAYALSFPLLVNKATGKKFGKSEGGAVWLDPHKTSVFDFYQFWFNTPDADVEELLFKMTLLPKSEIEAVMVAQRANPAERTAQKRLAAEVTMLVHGKDKAENIKGEVPTVNVEKGSPLWEAVKKGLNISHSEFNGLVAMGGVRHGVARISDPNLPVQGEMEIRIGPRRILKITVK